MEVTYLVAYLSPSLTILSTTALLTASPRRVMVILPLTPSTSFRP